MQILATIWNCMFFKCNDMTYILLCIKAASILHHKQCHEMRWVCIWTFSQKWLYITKYTFWFICNIPYIKNIYILIGTILRPLKNKYFAGQHVKNFLKGNQFSSTHFVTYWSREILCLVSIIFLWIKRNMKAYA